MACQSSQSWLLDGFCKTRKIAKKKGLSCESDSLYELQKHHMRQCKYGIDFFLKNIKMIENVLEWDLSLHIIFSKF